MGEGGGNSTSEPCEERLPARECYQGFEGRAGGTPSFLSDILWQRQESDCSGMLGLEGKLRPKDRKTWPASQKSMCTGGVWIKLESTVGSLRVQRDVGAVSRELKINGVLPEWGFKIALSLPSLC